ncbi:hypothetical protein JST97_11890 [bacterium]|nr:hypothetical protein [bacterium]
MAYFALMLLPVLLGGRWRRLLRVLVPSWRFFENAELPPRLWLRYEEWEPGWKPLRRALWFNPEDLLELACRDLVHALCADLEENSRPIQDCESYLMLVNLARERGAHRFKLCQQGDDIFLSASF